MRPFSAAGGGHGIRETKGDELHQSWEIAMRQVAALVPPKETLRFFFIRQRAGPAVLARHELAEVFAFGAPVSDPARG